MRLQFTLIYLFQDIEHIAGGSWAAGEAHSRYRTDHNHFMSHPMNKISWEWFCMFNVCPTILLVSNVFNFCYLINIYVYMWLLVYILFCLLLILECQEMWLSCCLCVCIVTVYVCCLCGCLFIFYLCIYVMVFGCR